MQPDQPSGEVVRFAPTSGRLSGVVALVLSLAAVLVTLVAPETYPWPVLCGGLLFASLAWAAMLKPRVWAEPASGTLVLRNMFETVRIPLAALETVVVQQLFVVVLAERRFTSSAVGRSRFRAMRRPRSTRELAMSPVPGEGWQPDAGADYADYVEEKVAELARDARRDARVEHRSPEQAALAAGVQRQPAWLEIGLVAATLALFVASLWF